VCILLLEFPDKRRGLKVAPLGLPLLRCDVCEQQWIKWRSASEGAPGCCCAYWSDRYLGLEWPVSGYSVAVRLEKGDEKTQIMKTSKTVGEGLRSWKPEKQ
jgi:hypothetical protein